MPQQMMDEFDRWLARLARVSAVLLAIALVGYVFVLFLPATADPYDRPVFVTEADRAEHYRLLKKHGLQYDVAVIYKDRLGWYFIRDGQRCAFK